MGKASFIIVYNKKGTKVTSLMNRPIFHWTFAFNLRLRQIPTN